MRSLWSNDGPDTGDSSTPGRAEQTQFSTWFKHLIDKNIRSNGIALISRSDRDGFNWLMRSHFISRIDRDL